ncbi:hepatitis A virus cellular receptor 1 homolog isoform X2 [Alexandromys fortis]|uniref:hepatitis A virus cellular receptor 1 homolog isoform X2 n=1 Tax=Alexandromys fortis TaxID=100897 RepID=UPI002152B9EB|nr:hepatitis A virus cellular receptor 1 homolog isoform X2 [Microtus fortis]
MMHPQVFISSLILLLPGAVDPYVIVKGVVGHPVTLPCIYSTYTGISYMSWDLGECQYFNNYRTLVRANAYQVTYQRSSRYQLKGRISEGDVSLTIENAVQTDSGLYCCLTKIPGSFHSVTYSLDVKPEIPASPPTRPTMRRPTTITRLITTQRPTTTGRPTTTQRPTTLSTGPTRVPASPRVSTSTPTTPAHTQTHTPDWNNTVTSSDDSRNNYTESIPSWNQQKNMSKGFYIGVSTAALLLLLLVCTAVITRCILMKKKSGSLSLVAFRANKIGTLQNTAVIRSRAEDNVYTIEDTPTLQKESQKPS